MVLVKPLTVHWHQDSAPIYSVCFQPKESSALPNRSPRLITAGGDNNVRVWRLRLGADPAEPPHVEYYSTLAKHERAVNVVKFDPSGQVLASAGDDGVVCLWALNDSITDHQPFGADYEDLETWRLVRKCRTASFGEIYDLAWSPTGQYLAATSMDKVVSILDATDGGCVAALRDHKHYVQGVTWDPQNEFLATQSSDQRVLIYPIKSEPNKKISIGSYTVKLEKTEIDAKRVLSFHPESFSSFFRRLSFSPDGALLVVPACQIDIKDDIKPEDVDLQDDNKKDVDIPKVEQSIMEPAATTEPAATITEATTTEPATPETVTQNCAIVYPRGDLRKPAIVLPLPKPSTVVRFSPILYKLRNGHSNTVKLPYRMIYAIATLNGVFIYDTEQPQPLGMASNLHYSTITDLSWSPDGRLLLLTSIDGFCSVFRFGKQELGEIYEGGLPTDTEKQHAPALTTAVSTPPVINTLPVRKKPSASASASVSTNSSSSAVHSNSAAASVASASAVPTQESAV